MVVFYPHRPSHSSAGLVINQEISKEILEISYAELGLTLQLNGEDEEQRIVEVDDSLNCKAENWTDGGPEHDSEWEDADIVEKKATLAQKGAHTMKGFEAKESGGINRGGVKRGLYSRTGSAARTTRTKKADAQKKLGSGKLNERQYKTIVRQLEHSKKQNEDLKKNTPTLMELFARKRAASVELIGERPSKHPRLSEDTNEVVEK
ncbi:hypothetical protein M408DRAFT_316355 [Serendipita vermifera MAFF 305830]|uniref:Uncharacterized protein n=1 Tax=Serendipita vermifera MAFF 305830 TaxID=933852 RepID=A0A0C3B6M5_SERVB|nr:hypothetical protein M408DRAFT_316355 [Serendipita vermifera MAFF 305830]